MQHALSPYSMRVSSPVLRWQEATPVGNGILGALVFGHPREELLQTNHGRLFEEPERVPAPEMADLLPEFRRLLLAGKRDEAGTLWHTEWYKRLGKRARLGAFMPGPILKLHTETEGMCSRYSHVLDFSIGIDTLSFCDGADAVCRRIFASRKDDALIIEVKLERPTDLCLLVETGCKDDGELSCTSKDDGTLFSMSPGTYALSGAMCLLRADCQKTAWDGCACRLERATYALFAYTFAPVADQAEACYAHLKTLSTNCEELICRHVALHRPLMEQIALSVNGLEAVPWSNEHLLESLDEPEMLDALILRLFHFGRYLLISSCRPGSMPPNLQGIWNGKRVPPWDSDFHNDINIEMNFWQAPMGGLNEMMLALFDYYESLVPDFQDNARRIFGQRGILMSVSQTVCGYASSNRDIWPCWTGGAAWIAQHFFDYWRYTGDDVFLKNRALPFMREAALFYEDFVDFSGDTAVFVPSISPENVPNDGQDSLIGVNATMDIMLARELFSNLIAGYRHLDMDSDDVCRWEGYLNKLPPYEVDQETGCLREWLYPGLAENPKHRHLSHLYGLFPGEEIDPEHPMYEPCRRAVDARLVVGLNAQGGWSLGHMACLRTRLGQGDEAFQSVEILARSCVGRNLLTCHNDWRAQGNTLFCGHAFLGYRDGAWGGKAPFQIDANMCIPAVIMNMFLQVHGNTVQVLPALPSRWKRGNVKGLCLPYNVRADIMWEDGKAEVTLYGENAGRYVLSSPLTLTEYRKIT